MDETRGPSGNRQVGERYEIRLKGHLDGRWAAWFYGLSLTHSSDGTTLMRGSVADQAALHGLLQKLRDLGLPLVSVTEIEPAPQDARHPDSDRPSRTSEKQGDRHD